jgi:hypothetical protein
MSDSDARHDDAPTGPANPRSDAGPDAPTPPGGPQRSDAPQGDAGPGPVEPDTQPEPPVHAGTAADGPTLADSQPEPTADGSIHATTQADQVNEELQEENAESALDQPSDGSGGE